MFKTYEIKHYSKKKDLIPTVREILQQILHG